MAWRWGRRKRAARGLPEQSGWTDVGGLRLHHRVLGHPGGRPVVFLHGLMGHAEEWDVAVRQLATAHQVWVLDQRGHGRSDWADEYSVSVMAEDLIAWCGHVGITGADVIGHSMGARVALLAASRRPDLVRRLALIDAGTDATSGQMTGFLSEYLGILGSASYPTVSAAFVDRSGGPRARPELIRHFVEHALVRADDGRYRWRFDARGLVGYLDSAGGPFPADALTRISCPVLLLRGEHSQSLSAAAAAQMVERFDDARLVTITDAGHDIGMEQPEQVARAALDFLGEDGTAG